MDSEDFEMRKHMAEVRSARGGRIKKPVKATKRRRGGRSHGTRMEQTKRVDVGISAFAKKAAISLKGKSLNKTKKLFSHIFPDKEIARNPGKFWTTVVEYNQKFSVRNADLKYLEALVVAYGIYNYVRASDDFDFHIRMIRARLKSEQSSMAKFDLLKAILKLVIDYRGRMKDGVWKINNSAISRDALAVAWLDRKNIAPYKVVAYQDKNGGGVDKWSRLMSKGATSSAGGQEAAVSAVARHDAQEKADRRARRDVGADSDEHFSSRDLGRGKPIPEWEVAIANELDPGDILIQAYLGQKGSGAELLGSYKIWVPGPTGKRRTEAAKLLAPIQAAAKDHPA
jgi:hypothetical protein